MIQDNRLIILTGDVKVGKTTVISQVVNQLQKEQVNVKGVYSPGRFKDGVKTGIFLKDISSLEIRLLGRYQPGWDAEVPKREWKMIPETLSWGNNVLKRSLPAAVLIIDELGFLEFEKNQGLISAFDILAKGTYKLAIVVVRRGLIPLASAKWDNPHILEITENSDMRECAEYLICHAEDAIVS